MMSSDAPSVAVIIVNYRQERYLKELLESLRCQSLCPAHTFLVHAAETDFRPPSWCETIHASGNPGYAGCVNLALPLALDRGAEAVLILNADTRLDVDCLDELMRTPADIVQPLILLMKKPDRIDVAGLVVTPFGMAYCSGYGRSRSWAGADPREIEAASGAAMLVHRRVFERAGLMDPSFFLYLEDVEFSQRARSAGFSIQLQPKAVVWHDHRLRFTPRKIWLLVRNALRLRSRRQRKVTLDGF